MIDTDKYEGHTPAPWELVKTTEGRDHYEDIKSPRGCTISQMCDSSGADAQLIADAPLLLAEVMRLRENIIYALNNFMFVNGELEAFLKEVTDFEHNI